MRKEMNALTEWLAATDTELTKRSAVEGMPSNLDAEIAWGKVKHVLSKIILACVKIWSNDSVKNATF